MDVFYCHIQCVQGCQLFRKQTTSKGSTIRTAIQTIRQLRTNTPRTWRPVLSGNKFIVKVACGKGLRVWELIVRIGLDRAVGIGFKGLVQQFWSMVGPWNILIM